MLALSPDTRGAARCQFCDHRTRDGKGHRSICILTGQPVQSLDSCEDVELGDFYERHLAREIERKDEIRRLGRPARAYTRSQEAASPELVELRHRVHLAQVSLRVARCEGSQERIERWRATLTALIRERDEWGLKKMTAEPPALAVVPTSCPHCHKSSMLYRDPDGWACGTCGWHLYLTATERLYGERSIGDGCHSLVRIAGESY
jgi:ribosomal protein S27AE